MLKWRRVVQAAILTGELKYPIVVPIEVPKPHGINEEVTETKPRLLQEESKRSPVNKPGAKGTAQVHSNKASASSNDVMITGIRAPPGGILKITNPLNPFAHK